MSFALAKLSGSTDGRPIPVVQIVSPGDTLHTAQASVLLYDMIELTASNISATDCELTLQIGNTTTGDQMKYTVPAKTTIPLGSMILRNALLLKAFAAVTNVINIRGRVQVQS